MGNRSAKYSNPSNQPMMSMNPPLATSDPTNEMYKTAPYDPKSCGPSVVLSEDQLNEKMNDIGYFNSTDPIGSYKIYLLTCSAQQSNNESLTLAVRKSEKGNATFFQVNVDSVFLNLAFIYENIKAQASG